MRYWAPLPGSPTASPAAGAVGKLYLPARGRYFGCRTCHNLTHRSCREHDKRVDALTRLGPEALERYRTDVETRLASQQARAEALEKSTLKGVAYQDLVFEAASRIARHFGDSVEPTGDQPGIGGSKVGDVVVTVNRPDAGAVPVRLVLEAKDRPMGLTPILRELEEAKENRGAAAAIAVYSKADYMPAGTGPFSEHGPDLYLCLYEKDSPDEAARLELAYRAARFWALRGLVRVESKTVNATKVREEIAAARKLLNSFTTIKAKTTQIRNAVGEGTEDLEKELNQLRDGLPQAFERMDADLAGAPIGDGELG